jgi:cell division protein FtsQ
LVEPWRARRRRRIAAALAAVLALTLLVVVVLWFTPVLSVRHVVIEGARTVPDADIVTALDVPSGTPLLRVDADGAAARVDRIARVAHARVRREFPSTIRVTVEERTAMAYYASSAGAHLMDSAGVEFAIAPPPPGLPQLRTAHPGPADPATRAALTVLAAVPPELRSQVKTVAARTISDIVLTLRDGRVVQWGGVAGSARKAAIALPLLTRPGHSYDISSPDLPTVR